MEEDEVVEAPTPAPPAEQLFFSVDHAYDLGFLPTTAALLIMAALLVLAAVLLLLRRPLWALIPLLLTLVAAASSTYLSVGTVQMVLMIVAYIATLVACFLAVAAQRTAPAPAPAAFPAGWYPDPNGDPLMRYYDGVAWTAHTAPKA